MTELERKFAMLTPENKKDALEYADQLLEEQKRSMTREEAKKMVSELTTEQKEKLYSLLVSIKGEARSAS